MKSLLTALLCAGAIGAVAAPALAQPYNPPPGPAMAGHDIRGQLETLEHRIQDGDRMHQLDRGEFDRATRGLNNIRDTERDMRSQHNGDLNDYDRAQLQQRIDQLARSIHWMRENGPGLPPPPPIAPPSPAVAGGWSLEQREDWMQQRIDHARADGSLGRREAYRATASLNDIRRMQANLTRRDGGRLNGVDHDYVQTRLDHLRQTMHWMRDNDATPPWGR